MKQAGDFGLYGVVNLPNEDGCIETTLYFERVGEDCIFQSVRAVYEGSRAGFTLQIFRNDDGRHYLEVASCSASEKIMDLSGDDLSRIQAIFHNISCKYDLSDREPGCEVRPYFRQQAIRAR